MVKKCFKFLDTFGFSCKDKTVFMIRQSLKIYKSIIRFNPIKVMNNPTLRQGPLIKCFPNQYMFEYISPRSRSWVLMTYCHYITFLGFIFTASPVRVFCTLAMMDFCKTTIRPFYFRRTTITARRNRMYQFPTILTWMLHFYFLYCRSCINCIIKTCNSKVNQVRACGVFLIIFGAVNG